MATSRLATPKLTTVRQDTFEAGRLLVSSILDPVRNGRSATLATELIVHEPCGA